MTDTEMWIIGLAVAFFSGGFAGAVLNTIVTTYRNRIQPVGYSLDIIDIFQKGEDFPRHAQLSVVEHPLGFGQTRAVNNFSMARITVTNQGNQDFKEFSFGVTMDGDGKSSDVRFQGADRHHVITMGLPTFDIDEEPKKPIIAFDFNMAPFNRGDTYEVDIYYTYEKEGVEFKLSSSYPVRFAEKGMAIELAKGIGVTLVKEVARKSLPMP